MPVKFEGFRTKRGLLGDWSKQPLAGSAPSEKDLIRGNLEGPSLPRRHAKIIPKKDEPPIIEFKEKKVGVKMLETRKGSPDGIHVFEYEGGKECDLPESQADRFVKRGWAKRIKEKKEAMK